MENHAAGFPMNFMGKPDEWSDGLAADLLGYESPS